jgi:hypothetical protein
LSERRDAAPAEQFFRKALAATQHPRPRAINMDGNPSYPRVVEELRQEHKLGRHCRCRTSPYLNNIIEQDHRALKRRVNAKQGFRSFEGAWRTIQGYEAIHMIRKGQVRWVPKGDMAVQVWLIHQILGTEGRLTNLPASQLRRLMLPYSYLQHFLFSISLLAPVFIPCGGAAWRRH